MTNSLMRAPTRNAGTRVPNGRAAALRHGARAAALVALFGLAACAVPAQPYAYYAVPCPVGGTVAPGAPATPPAQTPPAAGGPNAGCYVAAQNSVYPGYGFDSDYAAYGSDDGWPGYWGDGAWPYYYGGWGGGYGWGHGGWGHGHGGGGHGHGGGFGHGGSFHGGFHGR